MPRNIEIKARPANVERVWENALRLKTSDATAFNQNDTFFHSANGRLKLRLNDLGAESNCELIFYDRPDTAGPKFSDFTKAPIDPSGHAQLEATLAAALGVIGKVIKRRQLVMICQTRVHRDDVQGLGGFVELEVCLSDDQSLDDGKRIAEDLMSRLEIKPEELLETAYIDILCKEKS